MKKPYFLFAALLLSSFVFSQNPFARYGYNVKTATSSKGEFEEFHGLTPIVEIGSVKYDTRTKKIVGFIDEQQLENEVSSVITAMSIDPLCEKYYWISPYAFCLNNPVRVVDPDGRDVWEINGEGHIVWKEESETHRLYSLNSDGTRNENNYVQVKDRDILDQLTTSRDGYDGIFASSSSNDAAKIFIFSANNSDVEWGLQGINTKDGMQFVLATTHENSTVDIDGARERSGFSDTNIAFDIHSHPGNKNGFEGTRGASGDLRNLTGNYRGDMERISIRYNKFNKQGISLPNHYVYHKKSKNLYHYTPWESSIFIKNIKNNNGLNFLLPKR